MEKSTVKDYVGDIILYMKSRTDLDLAKYRPTTLKRRISHRMMVRGFSDMEKYINCLYSDPGELKELTEEITINVTGFFRDRDVFDYMGKRVIPELIKDKARRGKSSVTVWSAGCSTGEEPYSIAMLLADATRHTGIKARVIGTDISEHACVLAEKGEYPAERALEIPGNIRRKYIEKEGPAFRVCSSIREQVRFQVHNIFSPPPVSRADMILCRNVIIHFKHNYRDEVLNNFYSALSASGYLILGKSEAVSGDSYRLFRIESPSIKLYRKLTEPVDFSFSNGGEK